MQLEVKRLRTKLSETKQLLQTVPIYSTSGDISPLSPSSPRSSSSSSPSSPSFSSSSPRLSGNTATDPVLPSQDHALTAPYTSSKAITIHTHGTMPTTAPTNLNMNNVDAEADGAGENEDIEPIVSTMAEYVIHIGVA